MEFDCVQFTEIYLILKTLCIKNAIYCSFFCKDQYYFFIYKLISYYITLT